MTANGRGTMRPQGRSPPFLLVGLLIAICVLGYSYWTVSSRSSEQALQLSASQDEIRMLSNKKLESDKRTADTNSKVAELERLLQTLKSNLQEKDHDLSDLRGQVKAKSDEVESVKAELDTKKSNLIQCEESTQGVQDELRKVKDEKEQLEQQMAQRPAQCGQDECVDPIQNILTVLVKSLGKAVIISTLQNNNIDANKFLPAALAYDPQQQQQQQQQQQPQQQPIQPVADQQNAVQPAMLVDQQPAVNQPQLPLQIAQPDQGQQGQPGQGQPGGPGQGQPGEPLQDQPGQGQPGLPDQGQPGEQMQLQNPPDQPQQQANVINLPGLENQGQGSFAPGVKGNDTYIPPPSSNTTLSSGAGGVHGQSKGEVPLTTMHEKDEENRDAGKEVTELKSEATTQKEHVKREDAGEVEKWKVDLDKEEEKVNTTTSSPTTTEEKQEGAGDRNKPDNPETAEKGDDEKADKKDAEDEYIDEDDDKGGADVADQNENFDRDNLKFEPADARDPGLEEEDEEEEDDANQDGIDQMNENMQMEDKKPGDEDQPLDQ